MPRNGAVAVLSHTAIMGAPLATKAISVPALSPISIAPAAIPCAILPPPNSMISRSSPCFLKMPSLSPTLTGMMASETELALPRAAPNRREQELGEAAAQQNRENGDRTRRRRAATWWSSMKRTSASSAQLDAALGTNLARSAGLVARSGCLQMARCTSFVFLQDHGAVTAVKVLQEEEERMPDLKLSLAITDNPRTLPVIDGRAKPEGIDFVKTILGPACEMFWRQLSFAEFDSLPKFRCRN